MCRITDYHLSLNLWRLRQSKFLLFINANGTTYQKNHSPNQNTGDNYNNNSFEVIIHFFYKFCLFVSLKNAKLKSEEKEVAAEIKRDKRPINKVVDLIQFKNKICGVLMNVDSLFSENIQCIIIGGPRSLDR